MPEKRAERLQVMLTVEEVRMVEEWRFRNRMPSRSAAVRALMNLGLRANSTVVDRSALLDGAVSSRDIGVAEVSTTPPAKPEVD
jgi:hypothetical protein